ncbi:tRNA epoxyqueuosine(34) reductase QueG [Methylophilaceae bacterium]|nr:tRNA epoxyqueuosine(34) reductase QueG [Betaproteobacteria bacterium]MDC0114975.1 tRNA epoxyqueuosine(34) reductase QueG [Methylophilaceae bacterium]MDC0128386.1 tRNA epoxyqueuosine(34) reductase QueG [Methylophilaceae bacterium]MDC1114176.1 tRNA epoxyqueuosine(34) reductase QueG [Methylophilaceae bacterium]
MNDKLKWQLIAENIKSWGKDFGFDGVGISNTDLTKNKLAYKEWIDAEFHGEMKYLERHLEQKFNPDMLLEGTKSIISIRLDYLPLEANALQALKNKNASYISRYALGRDYHKVIRGKLKKFIAFIKKELSDEVSRFRLFTDSAPVLEVEIAEKAGLGWRGKHTLLLNKDHGSWFFLGEIYTDMPLPADKETTKHCGSCSACIDICPTSAIIGPYELDAKKCISYLTIEHKESIPEKYRKAIGNRIYGCDDCQFVCPWNKYAKITTENDFLVRHDLDKLSLIDAFKLSENEFDDKFKGSAIYRIGYEQWLRNVAIGLGNAPKSLEVVKVLQSRLTHTSIMLKEHILWAIKQHN